MVRGKLSVSRIRTIEKKAERNEKKRKQKKKDITLLIILIVALLVINYPILNKLLEKAVEDKEHVFVSEIIDGDTIKVGNESVRLLGINAPEKGERYYEEAKEFLEDLILNKTVTLERGKENKDQYGRKLRYLFLDRENVNLRLVREGFANYYFPSGKDKYYGEFESAWMGCLENDVNLCEKSIDKCSACVKLLEFNHKDQEIIFENTCGFYCSLRGWEIKDEGRKVFSFPDFVLRQNVKIIVGDGENSRDVLYWRNEDYVWTPTGDTLFLRDTKGKLVLWQSY